MAVIGHETLIQAAHDGTLMLLMLPNLSKNVFLPICFSCLCVCCLHINQKSDKLPTLSMDGP